MAEIHAFSPDGSPSPGAKLALGRTGISSITSPEPGVWLIDQGPSDSSDAMLSLQESLHDKAEKSVVDTLVEKLESLPHVQTGLVTLDAVADTVVSSEVIFSTPFTGIPNVTATAVSGVPGTVVEVSVSNITETDCKVYIRRTSTVATNVMWIAATP